MQKNFFQAVPINEIKGLVEIELEDDCGSGATITATQEVSRINKIISNAPS